MLNETVSSLPVGHPDYIASQRWGEVNTLLFTSDSDFARDTNADRIDALGTERFRTDGDVDGMRFLRWVAAQVREGRRFWAVARVRLKANGEMLVTVVASQREVDTDRVLATDAGVIMLAHGTSFADACSKLLREEG
jgi:hypothetical protein